MNENGLIKWFLKVFIAAIFPNSFVSKTILYKETNLKTFFKLPCHHKLNLNLIRSQKKKKTVIENERWYLLERLN